MEGTCVGTTLAGDNVYYYNRPQSVYATHGYGPVLLAGPHVVPGPFGSPPSMTDLEDADLKVQKTLHNL